MKLRLFQVLLRVGIVLVGASGTITAQMLDPSIDRPDEPFCYFSEPTDVLGVMDGKKGPS